MEKLKIVAVASSEESRSALFNQLKAIDFVDIDGVMIELSDAARQAHQKAPDVIIVDLTGRELDGGLFIEAISMNPESPCVIFALHRQLNHQTILEAVRHGAKEFIQYPQDQKALDAAIRKQFDLLTRTNQTVKERDHGKLVTVFSSKGGSGCSTVAVNLAHEVRHLTQEPVIMLDMDQVFCNTAVMLNLRPNYSLSDLAGTRPEEIDDQVLRKITVHHESGLDLIVGTKNVLDDNEMIAPELLERTIDYMVSAYSFVFVDLPTHVLDPYHQYLVERSEQVLIVSCLDVPSLYRTRQYLDLAKQYLEGDKVKLILNRWNLRGAYGMSNKNLEEEFRHAVYCRLANDWELNVEANSLGCVLSKVNPNAELVKSLKKLASLIAGVELPDNVPQKRQGLLSKIFNLKLLKRGEEHNAAS